MQHAVELIQFFEGETGLYLEGDLPIQHQTVDFNIP
jgi:hypothetical protein